MAVRMLRAERQEMDGMKSDKTFAHWLPVLRVVHEGDANAPSPRRVWRETDWMFSRLKSVDDLREEELELVCDELLERYKNEHYVTIILTVFATRLSNAFESAEHMETHRYWHLMQTLDGMLRGKWLASRLLDAYFGKDTDARGEKVVIPVEDELSKAENVELVDKKEELNNNKDMEINIHDNQNVVVSDKPVTINQTNNYYGTNDAKMGTAAQRKRVVTEEMIARAICHINGKGKALKSYQGWLGVCHYLGWMHSFPRDVETCCKKLAGLAYPERLEIECKYENVRKRKDSKFMQEPLRSWPTYEPRPEEKSLFDECLNVANELDREIQKMVGTE